MVLFPYRFLIPKNKEGEKYMETYVGVGNENVEELIWSAEESGKWFDNEMHDRIDELGIYMDEFEAAEFTAEQLDKVDALVDGNEYPELKNALSIAKNRNVMLRIWDC